MATTTLYFEISVPHFVRFGFYYYAADDVQMKGRSSRTPWEATTKRKWKKNIKYRHQNPPPPPWYPKSRWHKILQHNLVVVQLPTQPALLVVLEDVLLFVLHPLLIRDHLLPRRQRYNCTTTRCASWWPQFMAANLLHSTNGQSASWRPSHWTRFSSF